MDETTQHVSSFVVCEFGPKICDVTSDLSGDSIELAAKLMYAVVERLTRSPVLEFGDDRLYVEVPAELLQAGFGSDKISFKLSDWLIEDYYAMLEEAESSSENSSFGAGSVDPESAPSGVFPASVLSTIGGMAARAKAAVASPAEHEADEWVLKCCGVVLMCGPAEEMIEEAERLNADDGFPKALTDYLVVMRAEPGEPRVGEDLSEGGGSHVKLSGARDEGLPFQDLLNDVLKRLGF